MRINPDMIGKSIFSGFILAISSSINLLMENRLAGAFLFSVGLTSIFTLGAFLYTGAIGNALVEHRKGFVPWLLVMLGANLLGCLAAAPILSCVRVGPSICEAAGQSWQLRISQSPLSAFLSACLCGFLVYIAWKANTKGKERPVISTFVIVLCVMIFVLAGFEHSIANSFLMFVSGSFDAVSLLYLLLMIGGNTAGAYFPALIFAQRQG